MERKHDSPPTETHPFEPFLPAGAKVLMLGSFPPQEKRWSMDFYYPNFTNDFWRICGLLFCGERDFFTVTGEKRFDKERIKAFCNEKGIAMYDTACAVRRLKGNASDKFLEVVEASDIPALLSRIPECRAVAATGQKAADVIADTFGCGNPGTGGECPLYVGGRELHFFRMPSTSRAYPLPLGKKAESYEKLFRSAGILP